MTTAPAPADPLPADAAGRYFADDDFDFAARTALGHAARGMLDIGQVLVTFHRIASGDPDGWFRAWRDLADDLYARAVARDDVDAGALLAYGISEAGNWLPRALAFEHRFVAACVDSGVMDVGRTWREHLPPPLQALLWAGDEQRFNDAMAQGFATPEMARSFAFRARPYGIANPYRLFTEVGRYYLHDVVKLIETPLLITDPADDQLFPGQPQELFDALPGEKVLLPFAREQGANYQSLSRSNGARPSG